MIPLADLGAQYAPLADEIEAAVLCVLRSGHYVLGPAVEAFERDFAAFCGVRHAVAVDTGTSALHLALLAANVEDGDEVITTPATFVATVAAILYANARPVLVDIDPDTWTIDAKRIEAAVTPRTKAIIPVHLHGRLADMTAVNAVAKRHGLIVIEDAAQAHGASRDGRSAGAFGDIGCFSFYPGKNLGACGEGGAIVTDRSDLADAVRCFRDWGQEGRYNHVRKGFNHRMHAVQGAVLGVKLKRLTEWTRKRRSLAESYDRRLASGGVRVPRPSSVLDHSYHVYAIRTSARDRVQAELAAAGVGTGIHYPRPVHLQPAYRSLGYERGQFPVAEKLAAETLSLPIFPELGADALDYVADKVIRACGEARTGFARVREEASPAVSRSLERTS